MVFGEDGFGLFLAMIRSASESENIPPLRFEGEAMELAKESFDDSFSLSDVRECATSTTFSSQLLCERRRSTLACSGTLPMLTAERELRRELI